MWIYKNKIKASFTLAAGVLCFAAGLNALSANHRIDTIFNAASDVAPSTIVVFAGDPVRVCKGIQMLEDNKHSILYVSGDQQYYQSHGVTCNGVTVHSSPRIIFDHAVNTHDNGYRSAEWLRSRNAETTYLVTSAYHMQRSILELSTFYSGKIIPAPIETKVSDTERRNEQFKLIVRLAGVPIPRDYQFNSI